VERRRLYSALVTVPRWSGGSTYEENAGVNINSSVDYANALAKASVPLNVSSEAADQPREQEVESEMPQQGRLLVTAEQEYRAKAFELMTANVKANLDYANKLGKLRTPLEFIELSTTHAQKQFELIMSQTAALGALSRSLTMASAERMSADVERVFGHGQLKT
jgi:Phasin protein